MSYSNCGYPNMSIKKFQDKYPSIRVEKVIYEQVYKLFIIDKFTRIFLYDFHLEERKIFFHDGLYGYWQEEFVDDIRLLYKYLLKEYKKREELKRKREEDEKDN